MDEEERDGEKEKEWMEEEGEKEGCIEEKWMEYKEFTAGEKKRWRRDKRGAVEEDEVRGGMINER